MPNQEFSTNNIKSIKDTSIVHQRHQVLNEKYLKDNEHLSPLGHEYLAEEISKYLKNKNEI